MCHPAPNHAGPSRGWANGRHSIWLYPEKNDSVQNASCAYWTNSPPSMTARPQSIRALYPLCRAVAVALMLAFASPLVLPLFAATADPEASLPACCRRHGKHHCTMTAAMIAMLAASSGPALTAPPCPLYPTAAAPIRMASAYHNAPCMPPVEIHRDPAPSAPMTHRACACAATTNYTRGPPTRLA